MGSAGARLSELPKGISFMTKMVTVWPNLNISPTRTRGTIRRGQEPDRSWCRDSASPLLLHRSFTTYGDFHPMIGPFNPREAPRSGEFGGGVRRLWVWDGMGTDYSHTWSEHWSWSCLASQFTGDSVVRKGTGRLYFLPEPQLPSQSQSVTTIWLVSNQRLWTNWTALLRKVVTAMSQPMTSWLHVQCHNHYITMSRPTPKSLYHHASLYSLT